MNKKIATKNGQGTKAPLIRKIIIKNIIKDFNNIDILYHNCQEDITYDSSI